MKEMINDQLTEAVYVDYQEKYPYEVFLQKLNYGFELLEKNREVYGGKKKKAFELDELEAIKFALEYNQAKLIKLLKETQDPV